MRFVLLEHDTRSAAAAAGKPPAEAVHWDLMVEAAADQPLRTWRLLRDPRGGRETPVEPLGPHRREYLTYEGEISGGRGRVRRVDAGEARWLGETDGEARFELMGGELRGVFAVAANAAGGVCFRRVE